MALYHPRYNSARFLDGGAALVISEQNPVKMRQSSAASVLVFIVIMPAPSRVLLAAGTHQTDGPLEGLQGNLGAA